jgi:hypothetical protein
MTARAAQASAKRSWCNAHASYNFSTAANNIDVLVFMPKQKVRMGVFLRNEVGDFIVVFSCCKNVVMTPAEAEA